MNPIIRFLSAGAVMIVLCVGFSACNEPHEQESGLGEEIPGMEIRQATGTIIGKWADTGSGFILVKVDGETSIGETINITTFHERYLTGISAGTYDNMIQVQHQLSVKIGDRISFSVREFLLENDKNRDLFIIGDGTATTDHGILSLPIYVITEYEIIND